MQFQKRNSIFAKIQKSKIIHHNVHSVHNSIPSHFSRLRGWRCRLSQRKVPPDRHQKFPRLRQTVERRRGRRGQIERRCEPPATIHFKLPKLTLRDFLTFPNGADSRNRSTQRSQSWRRRASPRTSGDTDTGCTASSLTLPSSTRRSW